MHQTRSISFVIAALTLAACGSENNAENVEQTSSSSAALSSNLPLPQGMTCGMFYEINGLGTAVAGDGYCDGTYDLSSAPPGYDWLFEGDMKRPATEGWYNASLHSSTQAEQAYTSDRLPLPRGITCGLAHTRNNPNATCLGDSPFGQCPVGWMQRSANDEGSSEYWAWCEYQDPHNLCANGVCRQNVPLGTVCGLSHNGPNGSIGICETTIGGPSGARTACPSGWTVTTPEDDGAPSGVGLQFCARTQ